MNAGLLTVRIRLERFNDTTRVWDAAVPAPLWAAVEPQGDARYRFRVRASAVPGFHDRADLEPAMRVLYLGRAYDLDDIIEAERNVEVHLIASRRIVEEIEDVATGTRGIKAWP